MSCECSYLLEEWKERHKELGEDVAMKFSSLPFVRLEVSLHFPSLYHALKMLFPSIRNIP